MKQGRFWTWGSASLIASVLAGCAGVPTAGAPVETPIVSAPKAEESLRLGFSEEGLDALNAAMAAYVEDGQVAGMVTLIARHGEIVDLQAHGLKDVATDEPMTTDTLFRLYSMTKPVTGVAMMMLYEEGKWQLDDPITKYLPEMERLKVMTGVDEDGNVILTDPEHFPTIREVMTHTAGFGYGLHGSDPVNNAFRDQKILLSDGAQALVDNVADIPLMFQPGAWWSYSVSVDLQARIVERISGLPFDEFLKTRIFDPLGMADTSYIVPDEKKDRLATLYTHDGKGTPLTEITSGLYFDVYNEPLAFIGGGHGLISTASDYAIFAGLVAGGGEVNGVRLLKAETVDLMLTNQLPDYMRIFSSPDGKYPGIPHVGFGLDWAVALERPDATRPGVPAGTGFWGGAAGTWFWSDPVNDLVFVGMIQCVGDASKGCPGEFNIRSVSGKYVYEALADPAE